MTWQAVIDIALAANLSVLLAELALRLPFGALLGAARRTSAGALRVLDAARVSDHWKQKAMLAHSGAKFANTVRLGGLLLLLGGVAVLLVVGFDRLSNGFADFMMGWWAIALTILWASIYLAALRFLDHGRLRPSRSALTSTRPASGSDR